MRVYRAVWSGSPKSALPSGLARLLISLALLLACRPAASQCTPTWLESDGLPGLDSSCITMLAADLGQGPRLYAGGSFTVAGGADAPRVAVYDGTRWGPLGPGPGAGLNGTVRALTVFNGQLIAGGDFTANAAGTPLSHVARWDGSAWAPMGAGPSVGFNDAVNALTVSGGELYAGGAFVVSGASPALRVARWTGSAWQQVGAGFNANEVFALAEYNGELYAGGNFTASGATAATDLARWDGAAWQPVGSATALTGGDTFTGVRSLAVYNNELVVAGGFTNLNGSPCSFVARWNGSAWTPMPCPRSGSTNVAFSVRVHAGSLYVGGSIPFAGGVHTARWTGSAWQSIGGTYDVPSYVYTLESFNGRLLIGGTFTTLGDISVNRVAAWDGAAFAPLTRGLASVVYDAAEFNDELYVAGLFTNADGRTARKIGRFDGQRVVPLAAQLDIDGQINALEVHNSELYAGGNWGVIGVPRYMARWNGAAWTVVAAPISGSVACLKSFNGSLVAGAAFNNGILNVGRWDGASWSSMGAGLNGPVSDLHIHNGSLYAAGTFSASGATTMNFVARWDGAAWRAVGGGAGAADSGGRFCLTTWNNQLVLGGLFSSIDGVPANGLARWNGAAWTAIPGLAANASVTAIANFGGGLVVGGRVNVTDQPAPNYVALWNGSTWSAFGQNFSGRVLGGTVGPSIFAFAEHRNELFVGGDFFRSGGRVSSFLAHWGSEAPCIQAQPADVLACRRADVALRVVATGVPALTFQWRRNLQPIQDGPAPGGSTFQGAATAELRILGLLDGDSGQYDVVVTNAFGVAESDPATVALCPADYNCDAFVDFFDYGDFVTAFETGVGNADFNADGFVDFFDYLDFVTAFEVGC